MKKDDGMRDEKTAGSPGNGPIDPIEMARRDLKKQLPRRFWTDVTVAQRDDARGSYVVLLDGRPVRTPGKTSLTIPSAELADAIAAEWRAQTDHLAPDTMPLTRLLNTAMDSVAPRMTATAAEAAKFAETDLVCYRAADPPALVEAQARSWDPILDFAHQAFGARFIRAEGVMYVAQPDASLRAVRGAVDAIATGAAAPLRLAAFALMTNLTGSVLLALAVAHRRLDVASAWAAAHIDEDYQMRIWGADAEAMARRAARWRDMDAAAFAFLATPV